MHRLAYLLVGLLLLGLSIFGEFRFGQGRWFRIGGAVGVGFLAAAIRSW